MGYRLKGVRKGQPFRLIPYGKEVNSMELSSSEKETIQHQYDALIRKNLMGEARNYIAELTKQKGREVNFSELGENKVNSFPIYDEYESDYTNYKVAGYDICIKNNLLAEALDFLPEQKRNIILMSYMLGYDDTEIGAMLNVVRSTIFRHRKNALARIKQYMEGKSNDEHK